MKSNMQMMFSRICINRTKCLYRSRFKKWNSKKKKKLTGDAVDNPAIRQNIFANQQRNRHRIQIWEPRNPNRRFANRQNKTRENDPITPQENQTLEAESERIEIRKRYRVSDRIEILIAWTKERRRERERGMQKHLQSRERASERNKESIIIISLK